MKHAVVYHSADFDGLGCYAIYRVWAEENGHTVTGFPFNYGKSEPSIDELMRYDTVFVGDACLGAETMIALAEAGKLVWIDHHITSISLSEEKGFDASPGLREVGKGACELTFKALYSGKDTPEVIQFLSAYDVFDKTRFDWEGLVLPFQFGMRNIYNLDACRFYDDYRDGKLASDTDAILAEGSAILRYIRSTGTVACGIYGFPVTLGDGYRAICLMTSTFGSLAMEQYAIANGYEVVINVNRFNANAYNLSCYAVKGDAPLNLGAYLHDNYGGGGHWNAAGATLTRAQFLRLIDKNKI